MAPVRAATIAKPNHALQQCAAADGEIVKFLTSVAQCLDIEWRLDIEGAPFGVVTKLGPDAALQGSLSGFLDMFPGDFESLPSRSREQILPEWSDR